MQFTRTRYPARPAGPGGRTVIRVVFLICILLVAPAMALMKAGIDLKWAALYAFAASLLAYAAQATDKKLAIAGAWRVPENLLHLLELLGGWPGSFLAQQLVRHKCSKNSYQFFFWIIVALHQLVALDYLLGWKMLEAVRKFLPDQIVP